jgi:hypothetical protein
MKEYCTNNYIKCKYYNVHIASAGWLQPHHLSDEYAT